MWIFTPMGFFSVVCAKVMDGGRPSTTLDPNTVMVRARRRSDLERLQAGYPDLASYPITEHAGTDYRYRIVAPKALWAEALNRLTAELDYGNFKGQAEREFPADREYHEALHTIWSVHRGLQA